MHVFSYFDISINGLLLFLMACSLYVACLQGIMGVVFIKTNIYYISSLVPQFQNKSKCEPFHMKMSSACSFIFMQIKVIFIIRTALHLDSLGNRGTRELGLLSITLFCFIHRTQTSVTKSSQGQTVVLR